MGGGLKISNLKDNHTTPNPKGIHSVMTASSMLSYDPGEKRKRHTPMSPERVLRSPTRYQGNPHGQLFKLMPTTELGPWARRKGCACLWISQEPGSEQEGLVERTQLGQKRKVALMATEGREAPAGPR